MLCFLFRVNTLSVVRFRVTFDMAAMTRGGGGGRRNYLACYYNHVQKQS